MNRGRWYFVYDYHDAYGSGKFGSGSDEYKEVLLDAATEEEAIAEAKTKLDEMVAKAKANWENQKKTWAHPPASPFADGPWNPRVIYKIPL